MVSLKNISNLEEKLYKLAERYDLEENVAAARKLMKLMINIDKKVDLYLRFNNFKSRYFVNQELIIGITTSLAFKRTDDINYLNVDNSGWALEIKGDYKITGNNNLKYGVLRGDIKLLGYKSGSKADFYDNTLALGYKSGELAIFHDFSEAAGYGSGFGATFYDFSKASGSHSGKLGLFYNNSDACGYKSAHRGFFYDNSIASGCYSAFEGNFKDYSSATGFQSGERGIYNDKTSASGKNSGKEGKFYNKSNFILETNAGVNSSIYRDEDDFLLDKILLLTKNLYKDQK